MTKNLIKIEILIFIINLNVFPQSDSLTFNDSLYDKRISSEIWITNTDSIEVNKIKSKEQENKSIIEIVFTNPVFSIFWSLIIGIIAGIIASVIILKWNRRSNERELRNSFKYLEGVYDHFDPNNNSLNSYSKIVYRKSGELDITTYSDYDDWNGTIVMNRGIWIYGAGIFKYKNRMEGGTFQIIVNDNDCLYFFPNTLTHEIQKRNF